MTDNDRKPQLVSGVAFYSGADVVALTGLSRTTIWRMGRRSTFPKPVKLGERRVGWRATEIDEWIGSRAEGSVQPTGLREANERRRERDGGRNAEAA